MIGHTNKHREITIKHKSNQTNTDRLRSNIKANKQTQIDYYFIRGYGGGRTK